MFPSQPSLRRMTSRRRRSVPAMLERLEARIVPSTFKVATESDLRNAIITADGNSSSTNTINLTTSITLTDTTAGQLVIQNATSTAKTLTIEGQGSSPSATILSGSSSWNTRILEMIGTGTASVTVVFKDLEITHGEMHDGGILGGTAALGGGLLIDGGQVTLSHVTLNNNVASVRPARAVRRAPGATLEATAVTAASAGGWNLPGRRATERDRHDNRHQRREWR